MRFIVIVLILLYLVLVLCFSYMQAWKHRSIQRGLYTGVICIGFPMAGFVILWVCDWLEERKKGQDYSEIYIGRDFQKDNLDILREIETDKEINQVPMSEALTLNRFDYRRNMIMQLLNEADTLQYLDVLQDALDNEDTETSHYASTVIMELQRKVQEELIAKEVMYEQDPQNKEAAADWEAVLYKILGSNIYDEQNKKRYYDKYRKVSDGLLAEEKPEERYLNHRCQVMLMGQNYTDAEAVCEKYLEYYPASEEAVLCQVEILIQTKNSAGMKEFLRTLSDRPVVLTQKTLKYIRVFD